MKEKINIIKILEGCPKGTKLWSPLFGYGTLLYMNSIIVLKTQKGDMVMFDKYGNYNIYNTDYIDSECLLFPSKDNRDWSKFKPKKFKFDPSTLQPFDKVLVRENQYKKWFADFVCMPPSKGDNVPLTMSDEGYNFVIPYNDETKNLVGTTEEAPEYYRYWDE